MIQISAYSPLHFSYLGTQEAEQDLKSLSNDADSRVADLPKERLPSERIPSTLSHNDTGRGVV